MPTASVPLSRDQLLALAPLQIASRAPDRYRGDTVTTSMEALPAADRSTIRFLYDFLLHVYSACQKHMDDPDGGVGALARLAQTEAFDSLVARVGRLGTSLLADGVPDDVKRSIHDVRGGSLMALIMHLDMALGGEALPEDTERVFLLARDHLKMMRNAIHDLDRERYVADLEERAHGIELLREKWTNVIYRARDRAARVAFHCDFDGAVSQRCMEFSALDRVIYNLVNNASEHAENGQVDVLITAVDEQAHTHVRFAVVNQVSEAQRIALEERFGGRLSELYKGGFTTGGHGIGLRVCGDFVTHGYGRPSLDAALEDRLLGVDLVGDRFVAWFHWPAERFVASGVQAAK